MHHVTREGQVSVYVAFFGNSLTLRTYGTEKAGRTTKKEKTRLPSSLIGTEALATLTD